MKIGRASRWGILIFISLVLLISSSSFAAEVTLWHSYRGEEKAGLEQVIALWNKQNPDKTVLPLAVPYDAFSNKLSSAIPRGQGPDLFIFGHERLGEWEKENLLRPIDSEISQEILHTFYKRTVSTLRINNRLYGIPLALKSVALLYNKDLVKTPPKTTDEMIALAKSLTDPPNGRFGIAYEAGNFYYHGCWLHGFGGSVFGKDGNVNLDIPEAVNSVAFLSELIEKGLIPKEPTAALVTQLFNDGKLGMVINGPWFLGEVDPKIPLGVAKLPVVSQTGKAARPYLTVEAALFPPGAKNKKDAIEVAYFIATGIGARTRLEKGKQLVADKAVYDLPGLTIDPVLLGFKDQVAQAIPMPTNPLMGLVWEPGAQALRAVMRGAKTPEAALAKAQYQVKVQMRKPPTGKHPAPYIVGALLLLMTLFSIWFYHFKPPVLFKQLFRNRQAYFYLLPAVFSMLVLVFVPFAVGTAVAFFAHQDGQFTFVGLSNFYHILAGSDYPITDPLSFWFTLAVTVAWTAANVALHVSLGLFLAMLLRNPWLRLRGVYRVLLIIPWAVPNYITALIWKGMFHTQFGAVNALLDFLGIPPVAWFSHFWTAFAANVATNTWLGFPFMMVVCLGALQSIPKDLEEAAEMDGASAWTRFSKITLPQIKPALVPAVILGSVWTFNMFNIIYLVSGGEPDGATEILISEAYRWAFTRQQRYGYAAAYATLIFIALIAYSLLTRRVTGKTEAE